MSVFNKIPSQSFTSSSSFPIQNIVDESAATFHSADFKKRANEFEHALATRDAVQETQYSLFVPMHYEPGYAYPLLIWLHGKSAVGERQLMKIMPIISMRNYAAIAPRGITQENCYFWSETDNGFNTAQTHVFHCLKIASEKCHIAKRRVFLAGFGDGGTMAFRVAMQFPQYFAGVVSLCGAFPQGKTSLGQLNAIRQLPCLMCVGRDSPIFPPSEAAKQMPLFHTAGMAMTVRQYPCRQELSIQMLEDANRWLMERIANL
jgi:phospholipase/carboxylesterase